MLHTSVTDNVTGFYVTVSQLGSPSRCGTSCLQGQMATSEIND
jgi:hypothetical protein